MSVTGIAQVIVGFEALIQPRMVNRIKYDEDTGHPYQKVEVSHHSAYCEGIEVANTAANPKAFYDGEKIEGLYIFQNSPFNKTRMWIGVDIATVADQPGVVDFGRVVPRVVADFAKKHGLTPKQFLILSVD